MNLKHFLKVEHLDNIDLKIKKYLSDLNITKIQCLMFHSFDSFIKNNIKIIVFKSLIYESYKIEKI